MSFRRKGGKSKRGREKGRLQKTDCMSELVIVIRQATGEEGNSDGEEQRFRNKAIDERREAYGGE